MSQPEPGEGTEDVVHVPRRTLVDLRGLLIGVLAGLIVLAGAFIVRLRDADDQDDRFRQRDEALAAQQERLEDEQRRLDELISAEAHEEEREAAAACLSSHARYALLVDVLHIIAPEHEQAIQARYAPPTCNRAEAQAILDADPDEPIPADAGR